MRGRANTLTSRDGLTVRVARGAEREPRAYLVANELRVGRLHRRRQALDGELFTSKAAARAPLDGAKAAAPEAGAQY